MKILYFIEYMIVKCVCFVLSLFPLRVLWGLSRLVGYIGYYIIPSKRKIALENLDIAFGVSKTKRQKRSIAITSLQNFIFVFLEIVYFHRRHTRLKKYYYFDPESFKNFEHALSKGASVMYLTAHFGNWEMLSLVAGDYGQKMYAIGRDVKNPYLSSFMNSLRGSTDSQIIDKKDAVRKGMKVLRNKSILGTLVDQRAGNSGIIVDFFGKPVLATPFPCLMKLKYDCVLQPVFAIRENIGKFRIFFDTEITFPAHDFPDSEKTKVVVQAYTKSIESIIRAYPEQWLWYHRRWRL